MNQKSSLREDLKVVSWMLTGNKQGCRPTATCDRVVRFVFRSNGSSDEGLIGDELALVDQLDRRLKHVCVAGRRGVLGADRKACADAKD